MFCKAYDVLGGESERVRSCPISSLIFFYFYPLVVNEIATTNIQPSVLLVRVVVEVEIRDSRTWGNARGPTSIALLRDESKFEGIICENGINKMKQDPRKTRTVCNIVSGGEYFPSVCGSTSNPRDGMCSWPLLPLLKLASGNLNQAPILAPVFDHK